MIVISEHVVEAFNASIEKFEGVPGAYDLGVLYLREHLAAAIEQYLAEQEADKLFRGMVS